MSVPGDLFAHTPALVNVKFSNNRLTNIPKELFINTPALVSVDFNDNLLTSIPKELFTNTHLLTHILFYNNQITHISRELFVNKSVLYFVNFAYNQLTNLPEGLFDIVPETTRLHFHANWLSEKYTWRLTTNSDLGIRYVTLGEWEVDDLFHDFKLLDSNREQIIYLANRGLANKSRCCLSRFFIFTRLCILAQFVTTPKQFEQLAFCSAQQLQDRFRISAKLAMVAESYLFPIPDDVLF